MRVVQTFFKEQQIHHITYNTVHTTVVVSDYRDYFEKNRLMASATGMNRQK